MLQPTISQVHVRRDIEGLRNVRVSIHIPTRTNCTDCGWDEFTQAGEDIACLTCNGTGKVTTWQVSHATLRVMWVDPATPIWGTLTSGAVGDVWIQAPYHCDRLMQEVKKVDDAYITVDDRTVKPIAITRTRVEGISSLDVRCEVVHHEKYR